MINYEESQYLDLLAEVLGHGTEKQDRTGIGSKSTWVRSLRFNLSNGFPLFTSRQISFRIAFEEMMFFLRGHTDTTELEAKKIGIWKGNTSREFLDARGLIYLPAGDMGKGYGHQIRNFGGDHGEKNGFDQLAYLVRNIKERPTDRRHLMSYWHPQQVLNEAALPPCHYSYACQVLGDKLNAVFTMRSCDLYLGLPTNVPAYALLTHILAKLTGLNVGELHFVGFDCHLYKNQYEAAQELILRTPKEFPQFRFKKNFSTLDEALVLDYNDVEIVGYEHCGKMKKVEMAV